MTEIGAYQEYIRCKYNAFCKAVIRYAAIGKIIRLWQKWEREISLDYALADAISVLPEQVRKEILRYYFLRQPQRVIGACIGRTRSTAGRHIQIALRRLREEIERYRHE